MINKLVSDTLSVLDIPVCFQFYEGEVSPYITFFEYNQFGEGFTDNKEKLTGHYVQVDIWSKVDYTDIVEQVKELMINNNFTRTSEADLFEDNTSTYHKAMRFFYAQFNK